MSERKTLINAVDRALRILDLFSEQQTELKLTEISQQMKLHKSTVHGLLRTLAHHGYITQNEENGKYKLGLKFIEKGEFVLSSLDLRRIVHGQLRKLAAKFGETAHLVILEGGEAIYIDKVEGDSAIGMYSHVGKRAPIYCTAVGKVLVSEQTEQELQQIARQQNYVPRTQNTIRNAEDLVAEIQHVRQQGYAVDDEELEIGLRCIAVPIRDNRGMIIAAISISGPVTRLSNKKLPEITENLKDAAYRISRQLGYKN